MQGLRVYLGKIMVTFSHLDISALVNIKYTSNMAACYFNDVTARHV